MTKSIKVSFNTLNGKGDILKLNEGRINELLQQLSPNAPPINVDDVERILQQESFFLVGAWIEHSPSNHELIGVGIIFLRETLMRHAAYIEDFVVHKDYRGMGIGKALGQHLIDIARSNKVGDTNLTSGNQRDDGHALWKSLGFKSKDSTVFVHNLK